MDSTDYNMMNNKSLVIISMLLLSFAVVSAFGVSTPYWDENPLRLAPGESTVVQMVLQNRAGNAGDTTLRAKIIDDGYGIATLADENLDYFVPFGSDNVIVNVNVTVSQDVARGGIRDVVVSFTQIDTTSGNGMVSVSGGFTSKFPVFVVAPEESVLYTPKEKVPLMTYVWISIAVVVVILAIVILWLVLRKKKKGKKGKGKKKR